MAVAPNGRTVRARNRRRRGVVRLTVVVAAGALAATAPVEPSGVVVVDRLVAGVAAAVVAYAGRRSRRWALFVPAGIGASLAADAVGVACGVGAIGAASVNGWRRQASSRLGVLAAGLAVNALLRMGDTGPHGVPTLLAVTAVAPVLVSGFRGLRRDERRVVVRAAVVVGACGLVVGAGAAVAGLDARGDVDRGRRALDAGVAAARAGDADAAAVALRDAAAAFADAGRAVDAWWGIPGRGLPVVGHNLRAVGTAADLAGDVTSVAAEAVARAGADEVEIRAGRVPVDAIAALDEPVRRALRAVLAAQRRADEARPSWLLPPVADGYDDLTAELADARPDAELALDAIAALPRLLGAEGPRRYLVLFVTPVEGRATGFPGNYAELDVEDGDMTMTEFERITVLRDALPEDVALTLPDEYLQRYGRFDLAGEPRFVTLSPHFPAVAEHTRQLYEQATGRNVDGVMAVDPTALAALLQLTGPVRVPELDEPLTFENAEAFLLRDQYLEFADNPDRIDALETIGRATFDRLTRADLPGPTRFANVLAPVADAGHLRFHAFADADAEFLAAIGVTGALPPSVGDALAVTTNNVIGNKTDLFLRRSVRYEVEWDPATGAARAVAEITLRNDAPSTGLPDYVIGNASAEPGDDDLQRGTNRTYLSVFTALGLEAATLDGQPIALESHREQGRAVHSTVLVLAPDGGSATLRLELAGVVAGPTYRLDLWPQLLPTPDEVHVEVATPRDDEVDVVDVVLDGPRQVRVRGR